MRRIKAIREIGHTMPITSTSVLTRTPGSEWLSQLGRVLVLGLGLLLLAGCGDGRVVIEGDAPDVYEATKSLNAEYVVLRDRIEEAYRAGELGDTKEEADWSMRRLRGADADISVRLTFIAQMTTDLERTPSSYNQIRVQWEIGETAKLIFDQRRRFERLRR